MAIISNTTSEGLLVSFRGLRIAEIFPEIHWSWTSMLDINSFILVASVGQVLKSGHWSPTELVNCQKRFESRVAVASWHKNHFNSGIHWTRLLPLLHVSIQTTVRCTSNSTIFTKMTLFRSHSSRTTVLIPPSPPSLPLPNLLLSCCGLFFTVLLLQVVEHNNDQ